jgi:hypothetical protein
MRPVHAGLIVLVLGSISLCVGCGPYVDGYEYQPRPIMAAIPSTQPQQPPPVSVLATLIGVRREDQKEKLPLSVEVRLRFEASGAVPVVFDPRSLNLTNGELLVFPQPIVDLPQPVEIIPGQPLTVSAFFPFPPGRTYDNTDMQSFQLSWDVMVEDKGARQVVLFHRVAYAYYGPSYYYYPAPVFFSSGVVVVHHHH